MSQIIDIPGIGQVEFPDTMDDAAINAASAKLYQQAQAPSAPTAEPKSVGGFLGNVVSSGGRFLSNAATPLLHPVQTAKGVASMVRHPLDTAEALGSDLKARYIDHPGQTLYEDPVGVLGDVATLAGGAGAGFKAAGLVGKTAEMAKAAELAGAVSDAANPMRLLGRPLGAAARKTGQSIIRGTVRPSAALKREFGGSRAIADTIMDEGTATAGGARKALGQSAQRARAVVQDASGTATPIQTAELLDAAVPVADRAATRGRMGLPDETDAIVDRLATMERRNPNGIPLIDAQHLKQEAQDLATRVYRARDRGADVTNLGAETDEAVARGLREAIEQRAPGVKPENARTQRLMGAERALADAEDRPNDLSKKLALMTGVGGALTGNVPAGVGGALAIQALSSPRVGAMAGIAAGKTGRVISSAELARAALIAQLLGQSGTP